MTESAIQEHAENDDHRQRIEAERTGVHQPVSSCAVQAWPSGVGLMKGGPGLTKRCPVMCIRQVLIQKLQGKFWKKTGLELG